MIFMKCIEFDIWEIMKVIRRQSAIISLAALFVFVLTANVYFVYVIVEEKPHNTATMKTASGSKSNKNVNSVMKDKFYSKLVTKAKRPNASVHRNATVSAVRKIKKIMPEITKKYHKSPEIYKNVLHDLLHDLNTTGEISINTWNIADKWVTSREIVPKRAPYLGKVLHTLCSSRIIKAENAQRGTQLKLLLTLEGNQKAVFKPQWYPRSEVIDGPVYAGKDRHNAEVAAFHLSILLGLRRSPLTVGRKINLRREVMPVATDDLQDTFYQEGNNTCFYGVCFYCTPQDPVCAHKDIMEGALIMWLPSTYKLKKFRSPWQRTYKTDVVARWEVDSHYCDRVRLSRMYNPLKGPRLLDLIDASIFDFLIDNGDRHHYEVFENISNSMVLLLDNGKSFGNPHRDHVDILAPLYQCCLIRVSTWDRLQMFAGGALSSSLQQLLKTSHIAPVLTNAHFAALDRRLLVVYAAVQICVQEKGANMVFSYNDFR